MLRGGLQCALEADAPQGRPHGAEREFGTVVGLAQVAEDKVLLATAKLDDSAVYLDPGTPFMPFGYLPWSETAVKGLRLGADGGQWVTTTVPGPTESRVERKVSLKLSTSGTLEGKATVTYIGLEASWRRVNERNEDATDRRKFLEDDLEEGIPTGIDVKLINTPDWTGSETPLVAEFELRVPGWAAGAGNRSLMPMGLFGGSEKHMFEHSARVHPLYFTFPYQHTDEVAIELPPLPASLVASFAIGTARTPEVL